MKPQDNQNPRTTYHIPQPQQRPVFRSSDQSVPSRQASQQQATANIIRGQLDNIYSGNSGENTPHTKPVIQGNSTDSNQYSVNEDSRSSKPAKHGLRTTPPAILSQIEEDTKKQSQVTGETATTPYLRTMNSSASNPQVTTENQWQQYHEAWQKYYQTYYERHFLGRLYAQQKAESETPSIIASHQSRDPKTKQTVSPEEAMVELRQTIRQKVIQSTQKVKKSRHFAPVIAGLSVLLIVSFLQWNRVIVGAVAAYTSPGNIEPQNIIANPTAKVNVGPEPRMIIPKINVDAPVVYGVGPDHNSQMKAMESGIAHFSIPGANAVPGQIGNTVLAAHSSNDIFAPGDYKVVFAKNEKLVAGDTIYMHYEGTRYAYAVTKTEVVLPTEVSRVQLDTDKPMITLISCVPLGTAQKRLLVFAEQVSPDPTGAPQSVDASTQPSSTDIPGRPSPTLLEKLFGSR